MGLKVDSSFLKFVTMGAIGARRVRAVMEAANLEPIELERFSCNNKIWTTKVKRLRMPDLLCVKTGTRVEVRAKSKLSIKMSDAENNPDRRWDSGLRSCDLIAFVLVKENEAGEMVAADNVELFEVSELIATVGQSKLSDPKAATEGKETDRVWPSIVPNKTGVVTDIGGQEKLCTLQEGRRQTYMLRGKSPYLAVNEAFNAECQFLAGVPARKAVFPVPTVRWDPRGLLGSASPMDRHVAVKALGVVGTDADIENLLNVARTDKEERVALEAAASAARLGSLDGLAILKKAIREPAIEYLAMEAVLILAEYKDTPLENESANILAECANDDTLSSSELRQAAIWGLGCTGLMRYNELLPYLNVENADERIHAVAAFGSELDEPTARKLVETLANPLCSERTRAGIAFVLSRLSHQHHVVRMLAALFQHDDQNVKNWALSILAQLNVSAVNAAISDQVILDLLKPIQLLNPAQNWTRDDACLSQIAFISKQTL